MKYLYLLLLLCLPLLVLGQPKFDYTISEPYKNIRTLNKFYLSSTNKDMVLAIKLISQGTKGWSLQYFNKVTMKEERRNTITLPIPSRIEHIHWWGEHAYLYYSYRDEINEIDQLFYHEIDVEQCTLKGEAKRLVAVKGKVGTNKPSVVRMFSAYSLRSKFSFTKSYDQSKLLIEATNYNSFFSFDIDEPIITHMYVFDHNHNKLVGSGIKMPYSHRQMDHLDYYVDTEGNPYLLAKVRFDNSLDNTKGKGANKIINYHLELLKFDIPAGSIQTTKIETDGNELQDLHLYEDSNNNMICAGLYGNKTSYSDVEGFFACSINNSQTINYKVYHKIPWELTKQYESKNAQDEINKHKEPITRDLKLKKLIVQEDNSLVLIAEEDFFEGNSEYYYRYYTDIIITKINSAGQYIWIRKIPKTQKTANNAYNNGSFKYMGINDTHYIFIWDRPENINLPVDQAPLMYTSYYKYNATSLIAYSINDSTGKIYKTPILHTANHLGTMNRYPDPYNIVQCSPNEFILETNGRKKQDVMIKVKVE
jgi:hypothetical protein